MNKKDLKKAIKNGQCIIVIDNNVEVRYKKNDEEIVTKYNITPVAVDEVDSIIMDTVNKCLSDNGEIRHYFVENVIIRAIIDNYTNIPNDMLDEFNANPNYTADPKNKRVPAGEDVAQAMLNDKTYYAYFYQDGDRRKCLEMSIHEYDGKYYVGESYYLDK